MNQLTERQGKTGIPDPRSRGDYRNTVKKTWRNGKPHRLGKIGKGEFFKMDEKTTPKYATACPQKTYVFCNWPELAPIGPNGSHSFPMVPNWPESARIGPFRPVWFRFESGRFIFRTHPWHGRRCRPATARSAATSGLTAVGLGAGKRFVPQRGPAG